MPLPPIPFAPPRIYDPTSSGVRIADLIMRQGDIAARGAAANGQIWGNAVQQLGQIGAQAYDQYRQEKVQKQKAAALNAALGTYDDSDPTGFLQRILPVVGPDQAVKLTEGLQKAHAMANKNANGEVPSIDDLNKSLAGLHAMAQNDPNFLPQNYDTVRQIYGPAVQKHYGYTLPPKFDPIVGQHLNDLSSIQQKAQSATPHTMQVPQADGTTKVFQYDPEKRVWGEAPGLPTMASKPEKELPPEQAYNKAVQEGRLDDAKKILENHKKFREAGITVSVGGPGGSSALSPEGVEYAATQYRITGQMPPLGMGKSPDRARIINAAAFQAAKLSQSPAVAIQKQAAYKADSGALNQMRKMSASAEAFETKAINQADIIADVSQKVNRTNWPIINRALLAGKLETGDTNTQLLYNAITTFTSEYAKIMEGATGSAAGSSDAARQASARLVSAALGKGTLEKTLDLMKKEMRLTIQGYDATIGHITERMGGVAQPAATAAPVAPAATPAPGSKADPLGIR